MFSYLSSVVGLGFVFLSSQMMMNVNDAMLACGEWSSNYSIFPVHTMSFIQTIPGHAYLVKKKTRLTVSWILCHLKGCITFFTLITYS